MERPADGRVMAVVVLCRPCESGDKVYSCLLIYTVKKDAEGVKGGCLRCIKVPTWNPPLWRTILFFHLLPSGARRHWSECAAEEMYVRGEKWKEGGVHAEVDIYTRIGESRKCGRRRRPRR